MKAKIVKIYSTPSCHFCHMVKDFLSEKGIKYEEFDVSTNLEKRQEMIDKSDQMGVPVIDIGGEITVGFDEERISQLLGL